MIRRHNAHAPALPITQLKNENYDTAKKGGKMSNISKEKVLDMLDMIEEEVAEGLGFQYAKWRKHVCDMKPEYEKTGEWVFDQNGIAPGHPAWVCSECHTANKALPTFTLYPDGNRKMVDPYMWAWSSTCQHCGVRMARKAL